MVQSAARMVSYAHDTFTEPEARAKLGKTVRLLAARHSIPKGSIGSVVDFHMTSNGTFDVIIKWDVTKESEPFHDLVGKHTYHLLVTEQ